MQEKPKTVEEALELAQQELTVETAQRRLHRHPPPPLEQHMTVCENVEFEMRDEAPRLAFSKHGSQGWTPVVH